METKLETRISDWIIGHKVYIEWKDGSDCHLYKVETVDTWIGWIVMSAQSQDRISYICVPLDLIKSIEILD